MKKLLFVIGEYRGYINANKRIALNIAKQLIDCGNYCKIVCIDYQNNENRIINVDGLDIFVYPANYNVDIYNDFINNRCESIIKTFLLHPIISIKYFFSKKNMRRDFVDTIKGIIKKEEIDCVLCFYSPFNLTQCVISNIYGCKKIVYQLDPYGLHEKNGSRKKIKAELEVFNKSDLIITTPVLYEQYLNNDEYKNYQSKMLDLNFPNIYKRETTNTKCIEFDDNYFNIVFLGSIDDSYRSPRDFLDFIINANFFDKVRLFFIGRNTSETCKEYEKNNDNINIIEPVSFEEANSIMNQNVFLLNINNTFTNQMPSKILDYMSSGNPIINVIKNSDDPTIKLIDNYELGYNYYEKDNNSYEDLYCFLSKYNKRRVDFNIIESTFLEYTPKYASKQLLNRISNENTD